MNNIAVSTKNLISVIIPCHNHGLYIDQTLESIFRQTFKNYEVVIVDAGSDDNYTSEKLMSYQRDNIRVIKIDHQVFPSEARNTAYSYARGNFLLTLDADDLIETTFMEKTLDVLLKEPNVGAASSKVMYFGYEDGLLDYGGGRLEDLLQSMGSHLCALIRRAAWDDAQGFNNEVTEGYEDWDFWLRMTKQNWSIHILPEILFYYRQKESSRVTDVFKNNDKLKAGLKLVHNDLYQHPFNYLKRNCMILNKTNA